MTRTRPNLGTPFGTDGPWLAALLDVVGDLYDLLDDRLPHPAVADGGGSASARPVSEPAPDSQPGQVVPVSEPAPNRRPDTDDESEPVQEPDEDTTPKPSLPPSPPRRGRGSGLDAWQAYANLADVPYHPDAGRDDIINACINAGVIDAE